MTDWIPFFDWFLRLIFGSKQQRDLKKLNPIVELVGLFERAVHDRSNEWLVRRTRILRQRLGEDLSLQDHFEHYRETLRDAQARTRDLGVEERLRSFEERLHENREELVEKYEGDAFQNAIESPLKPDNVQGLTEAYRQRMETWQDETEEELEQRFRSLWDHFCGQAPEETDRRNLWFLLPEAFAVVREVAHRRLGLRHYDVQILGGIALHQGRIAEMKTGEGKTLVATLPMFLNALTGKGAYLVTVNDYLARRDAQWMGEIYEQLGMEVGLLQNGMTPQDRQPQYDADVTYGTNNEFGFDYLRDNMAMRPEDTVQDRRHFAIIDEVDSVLIDEARTPLIISGQAEKSPELYRRVNGVVQKLTPGEDFEVDEKKQTVSLTDSGADRVEELMDLDNLFDPANMDVVHHVNQAIRANQLYERDSQYVVKDDQVLIVDEFTGRLQPGRRFGEGLHQAIEAKEGVSIEQENQTLATVTIQNYFRMFDKLSGMTGTADTEAEEFREIYDLDVVVVPTHKPDIRVDYDDAVYRSEDEKFDAVVERIEHLQEHDRPVLVGTVDIEKSERLGRMLDRDNIPHNILNAKNHEKEAAIVAQAGQAGSVTIATNMAGRGTDIVLGDEVVKQGCPVPPEDPDEDPYCPHDPICGLHVIGTERHEARRVDNQLRGRTARQGAPGASQFFVSLNDDLMRLYGMDQAMQKLDSMGLGLEEGMRIEHPWISKQIQKAQSKVEARNFEIRKQLLEYDNVMERQRTIIYEERNRALKQDDVSDTIRRFIRAQVEEWLDRHARKRRPAEDWPLSELLEEVEALINWSPPDPQRQEWLKKRREPLEEELKEALLERYEEKERELTPEVTRDVEKQLLLRVIDTHWKEHLSELDNLKQAIHLEGMAQREPLVEYKRQSFEMFQQLQTSIREDLLSFLFQVETVSEQQRPVEETGFDAEFLHESATGLDEMVEDETAESQKQAVARGTAAGGSDSSSTQTVVKGDEVGRNDPCPCGSGKKYKYCHGG